MEYEIRSIGELEAFAKKYIEHLEPLPDSATLIGLSGDLGAGKTAFVKAVAKALGIDGDVLSPTFVIAKFYALRNEKWRELVHIDAYRLEDESELSVLRFGELLADEKKLIFLEWPEQIGESFPKNSPILRFKVVDEHTRIINI